MFTFTMFSLEHLIALLSVFTIVASGVLDTSHCNYYKQPNSTCSKQLPHLNLTYNDCFIASAGTDQNCRNWNFQTTGKSDLGEVKLVPYIFKHSIRSYSAVNFTFLNVNWNYLRLQWKERGEHGKPFCRQFSLSPRVTSASIINLFYDCLTENKNELHEYDFKYEVQNKETGVVEGRYYVFQLPSIKELEPDPNRAPRDWKMFSYLDISALPYLTVYWQQPPPQLVNVHHYEVSLMSEDDVLQTKTVAADPNSSQLTETLSGRGLSGKVHVSIKMVFNDGSEGSISNTAVVNLVPKSSYAALYITLGIFLFGATSLVIVYGWFQSGRWGEQPVVLVLYKRARSSHFRALAAFAECLKRTTNARVLLDELDIPLSKNKDPFLWYQDAFASAEYILVVASPSVDGLREEGIYPNVDTVGLRLLAENYCDHRLKRFFSVVFPYTSDKDLPREAVNLKRFSLMKDFSELVWFLTHKTKDSLLYTPLYSVFSLLKKDLNVQDHCKPLLEAFRVAQHDLQTCESARVKVCEKQAQDGDVLKPLETVAPLSPAHDVYTSVVDMSGDDYDYDDHSTYPGNISELNLLGPQGEEVLEDQQSRPVDDSGLDIHELLL